MGRHDRGCVKPLANRGQDTVEFLELVLPHELLPLARSGPSGVGVALERDGGKGCLTGRS